MISEGFDILILSGLFLVLTWAEFRRPARKRLKIRILLNFLLCICFYFLIYPPHYSREYSSHSGLLLTDNFNQKTLDSLITIDPNLPIVSLRSKQRNYQTVTDISALQRQFPQIQKWSVLGNGLRETELAELSNRSLEFQLNQVPDGISQLFYPDYIEESTQFVLQGEFINDKLKATQLSLLFEDQAIDSVGLSPGLNSFHFMIGAKTAGRFNYKLVAADAGNNHVYSELLALPVYKRKSYSILILSNYPRFEERQLKNWLSEQQDKVSWRSKISKERYRFETMNRSQISMRQLSVDFFKNFELIILHADAFNSLRSNEVFNLKTAIESHGSGLLLLWDKQFQSKDWMRFQIQNDQSENYLLPAANFAQRADVILKSPGLSIHDDNELVPLLSDKRNQIISSYQQLGLGRVALMLATELYSLKFKDQESAYSQIWLKLIKSISRSAQINQFEFQKSIHYPDQEMQFVLFTDEKQPGVMVSNRSKATDVYLLQSLIDQSNWSGKFWPAGSGWHRFSSQIDTLNYRDIYVYPKQTWQSHQVAENRQSNQNQSVAITGSAQIKENVEIERIWFYLLTFILFLLLWLEEKF